ncbi:DUF2318 domain-containing protein [Clostridium boliviensis]|uniref:DUF2318 domain-containing protein n=1 Tax=Clostridium boliviensis TaxID=318465 RepID=A0ABU4GLX8_9CLOT|nr:DUF2318 domain-containing protein [Clostridium boliviensis]MDW2797953.1 DUF2318 domain-containing protein [Clostridium boliviensis]
MNKDNKNKQGNRMSAVKKSLTAVLTAGMAILVLSACSTSSKAPEDTAKAPADLIIPVSEISSTASYYPVEVDGTKMEVVAVKAPDGSIRTAFNTCQVCYDSGRGYYKQDGDVLVCQNCGNRFPMDRVEVEAGGCNPWPIFDQNKTVTEESITITSDFLKESRQIFANWKKSY